MSIVHYDEHSLAGFFPLMNPDLIAEMADDIAAKGQVNPIWLYEGQILDGRNRYRACVIKGIEPKIKEYTGNDPLGFVISQNLPRRHLDTSQRAMVAAKLATAKRGGDHSANLQNAGQPITQPDAAKLLNVSTRTVADAAKVLANGTPSLKKAVEAGEVSAHAAATVADLPKAEQREAVRTKTVAEKAAENMEKVAHEKQRRKWIGLIGTASKSLAKKILADPDKFSDEMLLKSMPKCCAACLHKGAPTRPCDDCALLRKPSLVPNDADEETKIESPLKASGRSVGEKLKSDTINLQSTFTRVIKEKGDFPERLCRFLSLNGLVEHKSEDRWLIAFKGIPCLIEAAMTDEEYSDNQIREMFKKASGAIPYVPERRKFLNSFKKKGSKR